jgi:iron complex transport system ATP-binding protein
MLELSNCKIGFREGKTDKPLLLNASLNIRKAGMVSLVGMNGSGKTSLLRTIMKIQKLLAGDIRLNGKSIDAIHARQLPLMASFVSTEQLYSGEMRVDELVALGRYPFANWIGNLAEEDYRIIRDAIDKTGLTGLGKKKIRQLSDGERQRTMIARALAQNTPLVLLDEPTAFLDVPHKIEIIGLLRKLCNTGKTVFFSTHDIELAIKTSDKIALIHDQNLYSGTPEDMILSGLLDMFSMNTVNELNATGPSVYMPRKNDKTSSVTWTIHALNRCNISISDENPSNSLPVITVHEENEGIIWNLHRNGQNLLCKSIEELLSHLKK